MTNNAAEDKLRKLDEEYYTKRKEIVDEIRKSKRMEVQDYTLINGDGGEIKLSELFGRKKDLIVIHNMGSSCPYCTLWADGLMGLQKHIESRTAFVIVSPDSPDVQKKFAESRDWKFTMISGKESDFIRDMGFSMEKDGQVYYMPGYSTFTRSKDGKIIRVGSDFFGPGDVYCSLWHMFSLLEDSTSEWIPRFKY